MKEKNKYMKKSIFLLACLLCLGLTSCQEEPITPKLFDTNAPAYDESLATVAFDRYLDSIYVTPYNVKYLYRMNDIGSNLSYNLVPARYEKAVQLAVLTKYLWFDVYKEVVSPDFLKEYGPRILFIVGSPAYNPEQGTETLGTAEGGIKVTLYKVNQMKPTNIAHLNEFFFHTMHHEFAHILHQTKSYPKEYDAISAGKYSPTGWQNRSLAAANELGFITSYAGMEAREDFVEVISCYITETQANWDAMLKRAEKGKVSDTETGKDIILRKFEMAKNWLANSWNIDIEVLREEVQKRQDQLGGDESFFIQLMSEAGFGDDRFINQ